MNFDAFLKVSEAIFLLSIALMAIVATVFVIVEFFIKGSR